MLLPQTNKQPGGRLSPIAAQAVRLNLEALSHELIKADGQAGNARGG
jgi:hypothetical protein